MANILGISCFYHDSSATLCKGNEIVAAAQEERFTRKKFENSFPSHAIDYCLKEAKIEIKDLDLVVFYEDPEIKWDRVFLTYLNFGRLLRGFSKIRDWVNQKSRVEFALKSNLGPSFKGKIIFSRHHLSHAASAFYPSPFERAAILTVDGVGEWASTSISVGNGNEIKMLKEQRFPHSLGFLYSAFTQYLGFKVDSGEYKVMGLAPYGQAVFCEKIKNELIELNDDGSLKLNLKYFDFLGGSRMINEKFEEFFGRPARNSEDDLTDFHFNLAKSIQVIAEESIEKMARYALQITGEQNLVLAGGVALNCVANGKLLSKGIVKNLWIQPCSGDGGGSLGAALIGAYKYFKLPRKSLENFEDHQKGSYLGPKFESLEIEKVLSAFNFTYKKFDDLKGSIDLIADKIAQGSVAGFFQGRMEFGPRALGARSIIADPRNRDMQKKLNLKIKFRESFRPFAPIVMEEKVKEWFQLDGQSPYMLLTTQIKDEVCFEISDEEKNYQGINKLDVVRSEIPAVTHVDYSGRVQTVSAVRNGAVYDLVKSFYEKTNCPVLINTSFNVRGEPIVCTPFDALKCFMNTNMDFLMIENFVLDKKDQKGQLVDPEFLEYIQEG